MNRMRCLLTILALLILLPTLAAAGSAKVEIAIVDGGGAPVEGAVIFMALESDQAVTAAIGETVPGSYEGSLEFPETESSWKVSKIVADGYLPVAVSIDSTASGQPVQEVAGMAINPGIPIPPINVQQKGNVRIDITMGDQREVMAQFLQARKEARAKAEKEVADQQAAAKEQEDYAAALKLYNAGDIEGSLPHFQKAIERSPEDADLRVMYARVLYKAGRSDEFDAAAGQALELVPGNLELRMMQYSSRRAAGDLQGALVALLAIREAGGSAADLLPHLRFIAQSIGQKRAAIPAYEAILDIDAGDADSCAALASTYFTIGEKALFEEYLARTIELAPERAAGLYSEMGSRILAGAGKSTPKLEQAAEMFRKALEYDPGYAPAYKKLGLTYWNSEEYDRVRKAFEKYLELLPAASDREQIEEYLNQLAP
jgi:tetratricopeptide (TPR) repeat protein